MSKKSVLSDARRLLKDSSYTLGDNFESKSAVARKATSTPSELLVPRFFHGPKVGRARENEQEQQSNPLRLALERETRTRLLESKVDALLTPSALEVLWDILCEVHSPPKERKKASPHGTSTGDEEQPPIQRHSLRVGAPSVPVFHDEAQLQFLKKTYRHVLQPFLVRPGRKLPSYLSYQECLRVGQMLQERLKEQSIRGLKRVCDRFFSHSTFSRFPVDRFGRISALAFFVYVVEKTKLERLYIAASVYDGEHTGYLREQDLEFFVYEHIQSCSSLAELTQEFYPFYAYTAVRRFLFHLDVQRKGRISIHDLISSPCFDEFFLLWDEDAVGGKNAKLANLLPSNSYKNGVGGEGITSLAVFRAGAEFQNCSVTPQQVASCRRLQEYKGRGLQKRCFDAPKRKQKVRRGALQKIPFHENWFGAANARNIYAAYLQLDVENRGMLRIHEMRMFNGGSLTDEFLTRFFQVCRVFQSSDDPQELELDYRGFLDLVLAIRYKESESSLRYFFRILDVGEKGYLDTFDLHYFAKGVVTKLIRLGVEPIDLKVLCNQIVDMVSPAISEPSVRITLQDLISCGMGHSVCAMLTDTNGFWAYETREASLAQGNSDSNA